MRKVVSLAIMNLPSRCRALRGPRHVAQEIRYTGDTVVPIMFFCFQNQSSKNADRVARMRKLISQEHCRSATQGSGWSLPDRFLYRGMRMLLFHRDLNALRNAARKALLRDLDADGKLGDSPMVYLDIEMLIWTLRWKSILFLFGFHLDAGYALDRLTPRQTITSR
jgi:hypothetical protein